MRTELCAIGKALSELGATAGPVDTSRLGDLLMRLVLVYGRYMNARKR